MNKLRNRNLLITVNKLPFNVNNDIINELLKDKDLVVVYKQDSSITIKTFFKVLSVNMNGVKGVIIGEINDSSCFNCSAVPLVYNERFVYNSKFSVSLSDIYDSNLGKKEGKIIKIEFDDVSKFCEGIDKLRGV